VYKSATSVLRQRLQYLRYGNQHGVSANWLSKKCDFIYPNVDALLKTQGSESGISAKTLNEGKLLFHELIAKQSGKNYGKNFDCEEGLAAFLYSYVLTNKPAVIVETGVANGITTNILMKALEKTGGALHSFDIDPKTKNVYRGKGNWSFHLLSKNYESALRNQVQEIGDVDLWIHDSNHGYSWQAFEYSLALETLVEDGVLVSDDIDSSMAWGMASESEFNSSIGVFDNRKFIGMANLVKKDS
jgi:predicted O-methyltransferase YrrM